MTRGWVLVLSVFLFVWEPMRIAGEFEGSIRTMGMRGPWAAVELLAHAAVAALCVASAWALWMRNPAGPRLATYAVVFSAAVSVQSLFWSALPHQTVPGEHVPFAILAIANAAAWLTYLTRSRRVRAIYE
jgi:hypothetical protein